MLNLRSVLLLWEESSCSKESVTVGVLVNLHLQICQVYSSELSK